MVGDIQMLSIPDRRTFQVQKADIDNCGLVIENP